MPELKIIPLGGMGEVTQNMFLYTYEDEILIFDCGIGFPDIQMPGADILIPDTRHLHHLLEENNKIVGMVLTHGHDDHIAATPYILPELPEFPIYASALTAGFAENRMGESSDPRPITVVREGEWQQIGQHFSVMSVRVTHSVPDTCHYFIKTPEGVIYHGSDFKLDKNPVDGVLTNEELIRKTVAEEKVLCMLVDCLRVEKSEWVRSESAAGPALLEEMQNVRGKLIVTLMSSHIHRIQQTVDAAKELGRKVAFVGRSVEQNVEVALRLGKLNIDRDMLVDKRETKNFQDSELCIIIAGSQGQEGSSLVRAVFGEHREIQITKQDKVIFSADAIPGNEVPYFSAIDELARNNVEVVYPDVVPDLHQSGHASAPEQRHLVDLIKPEYVMPIGGADRHRAKFIPFVTDPLGIPSEMVLRPDSGEVVRFAGGQVDFDEQVSIQPRIVDGLGIGDVGPRVLSDRRVLGESGMIVLVLPRTKGQIDLNAMKIVSRGFVFMKDAGEVMDFIRKETALVLGPIKGKASDVDLKKKLERKISKKLFSIIRREPMVIAEIVDL